MPAWRGGGGVGAHEQVAVVGDRGVRRPRLLARHHVLVAVEPSARAQRGRGRSRRRAPRIPGTTDLAAHDRRQQRRLLLVGAVGQDRRSDPVDVMYCGPRGSPTDHSSSPRMMCCQGVAARPPCSAGQCGVSQPRSARRRSKTFEWATFWSIRADAPPPRHSPSSAEATNERNSSTERRVLVCPTELQRATYSANSAVPRPARCLGRRVGWKITGYAISAATALVSRTPWITATSEAGVDGAPGPRTRPAYVARVDEHRRHAASNDARRWRQCSISSSAVAVAPSPSSTTARTRWVHVGSGTPITHSRSHRRVSHRAALHLGRVDVLGRRLDHRHPRPDERERTVARDGRGRWCGASHSLPGLVQCVRCQ